MKKFVALTLAGLMAVTMLFGCTKKEEKPKTDAKTPVLADVWKAIETDIGTDEIGSIMDADKDVLMQFYGISADDLDEYVLKVPMINVQADEYFIAKVKDGKMEDVKKGIDKRKADLDNTWKQYLPEVYEQVKNAKTVEVGNYILFAVGPHAEKAETIFNEQTK